MNKHFKKSKLVLMCLACMMLVTSLSTESVNAASKKSITLNKKSATLEVGKTTTIKVNKVKGLKNKHVTYKSSNKKVATVNAAGVVTGKKNGSATITVTSKSDKKVKATVKVKVVTDFFKKNKANIKKVGSEYTQKGLIFDHNSSLFLYNAKTTTKYSDIYGCSWNNNYDIICVEVTTEVPIINDYVSIGYHSGMYTQDGTFVKPQPRNTYFEQKGKRQLCFFTQWLGYPDKTHRIYKISYRMLVPKNETVYLMHGGFRSLDSYEAEKNTVSKDGQKLKKKDLEKQNTYFRINAADAKKALNRK